MTKTAAAMINISQFHALAAAGTVKKGTSIRLALASEPVATQEERVVSFVFSDNSVDCYGDTIDVRGWDLKAFESNPIVLFGHDPSKPENVIGKARNVRVQGARLVGEILFAAAEVNPVAETVYQMVLNGYLSAVSVGFEPVEWAISKDKARPGGVDFTKQKLKEVSIVPIPANENALIMAKAAGIDVGRLGLSGPAVMRDFKVTKRGLYSVSELAYLLMNLGWLTTDAEWEAEYENDGSDVPSRLKEALAQLGQILVDMTIEEVQELLGSDEDAMVELAAPTGAQKAVLAIAKALKVGPGQLVHVIKSDKPLSPSTVDAIRTAWNQAVTSGKPIVLDSGLTVQELRVHRQTPEVVTPTEADMAAEEIEALALRTRKARALKLQHELSAA